MPTNLLGRARRNENEFVFPYPDVLEVIRLATAHSVAILGVEMFEVSDCLQVQDYSGYEFASGSDWQEFVRANNDAALEFVHSHPGGEEHGYIVTAASEREFRRLGSSGTGTGSSGTGHSNTIL
ncbi:MAG: hypothetical protein IT364_08655 [Candidatus Hydrogenedentes bacterium]|nr:hypothetical protein [Candidatus Hydrogenedentota bacterium]